MSEERLKRLQSVLQEIRDWSEGKPTNLVITRYPGLDVKRIRKRVGMTQDIFAQTFHLDLRELRRWERGEGRPAGAVFVLLEIIDKAPEAALKALEESREERVRNAVVERLGVPAEAPEQAAVPASPKPARSRRRARKTAPESAEAAAAAHG